MVRTLLNKIIYRARDLSKGYILFNNEKIIDHGEEAPPEYELSEMVIDYHYKAYALHGFSLAVNPMKYLFRGINTSIDLSIYSDDDLKKICLASLYELYMNGVTLPITYGERVDIVNKVAKEHNLPLAIINEENTLSKYKGLIYIDKKNNELYINDEKLGKHDNVICEFHNISHKCIIIDITNYYTFNTSLIASKIYEITRSIEKTMELLVKPYVFLGLDHGIIDKNAYPDIIIYSLKDSKKIIPINEINYIILRGYPPDQVFVKGDIFFDQGEPMVILSVDLSNLLHSGK